MAKQVIGIGTTNDGTGDSLESVLRSQTTTLLRFTLFWVMVLLPSGIVTTLTTGRTLHFQVRPEM